MMRFGLINRHGGWIVAVLAVTALALVAVFVPQADASAQAQPVADVIAQSQVFNDDVEVDAGEVIDGDLVVYDGDVRVKSGGTVNGNLVVYNGDVDVSAGGTVAGEITALSGNVDVAGTVNGSVSAWSGDVKLESSASVGGDISVLSGEIEQARGATVDGSVLRGPNLKIPAVVPVPGVQLPGVQTIQIQPPKPVSLFDRLLDFVRRAFIGLLGLAAAVLVTVGLSLFRPRWTSDVRSILDDKLALSFAVGLLVNVLLLGFIGLLYITVCFRPPALLIGLGLLALNVAGWPAVGDEIGRRISERVGESWVSTWRAGIGIAIPGIIVTALWILGGCLGFFGSLLALALSSIGAGAVIVKVLKLGAQPTASPIVPAPPVPPIPPIPGAAGDAQPAVEVDGEAEAPVQTPAQVEAVRVVPTPSDFTQITGIGPKLSEKLAAAGVLTYADLAGKTPEEVGEILGWSGDRVRRAELIEQATTLAKGDN